jgi:glycosyltransferase involved in cell wall biosynthesis
MTVRELLPYHYKIKDRHNNVNILYLANYTRGKGHDEMLAAFEYVVKRKPEVKLVLAGADWGLAKNSEYKQELEEWIEVKGLEQNVEMLSEVEDIEDLYKKHQIFVNLSKVESFSNTCLEALVYGVPCVAYNSGGPEEVLEGGRYGILLDSRNPSAVASVLIELISDEGKRKRLSEKGRTYAREKFSGRNNYKFRELYNKLLVS